MVLNLCYYAYGLIEKLNPCQMGNGNRNSSISKQYPDHEVVREETYSKGSSKKYLVKHDKPT